MHTISSQQIEDSLGYRELISALREGLIAGASTPGRHHHTISSATDSTLLLMPAWTDEGFLGVKLVNVFPGNSKLGKPALSSAYILASATTGEHLAVIDGNELTRRRTVATSVLAATYLARPDSAVHLVVGAGHIGSAATAAYQSVFDIEKVLIYDHVPAAAERLASRLREQGVNACVVDELAESVPEADIITCATLATSPIIQGAWLRPGAHLDLIGSFRPTMREADDECLTRSSIYVDSPVAMDESGDLTQPMSRGIITSDSLVGTLPELCRGEAESRQNPEQITLFKAVGTGLADLTAAALIYEKNLATVSATAAR